MVDGLVDGPADGRVRLLQIARRQRVLGFGQTLTRCPRSPQPFGRIGIGDQIIAPGFCVERRA